MTYFQSFVLYKQEDGTLDEDFFQNNMKKIWACIEESFFSVDICYIEAYTPTHEASKKVTTRYIHFHNNYGIMLFMNSNCSNCLSNYYVSV